jgi:hypothetical protein
MIVSTLHPVIKLKTLTLSSELVDELGLPVEHDVFLVLDCFFLLSS